MVWCFLLHNVDQCPWLFLCVSHLMPQSWVLCPYCYLFKSLLYFLCICQLYFLLTLLYLQYLLVSACLLPLTPYNLYALWEITPMMILTASLSFMLRCIKSFCVQIHLLVYTLYRVIQTCACLMGTAYAQCLVGCYYHYWYATVGRCNDYYML